MNEQLQKKYEQQHQKTNDALVKYLAERKKLNEVLKEIDNEIVSDQKRLQRRSREVAANDVNKEKQNERTE